MRARYLAIASVDSEGDTIAAHVASRLTELAAVFRRNGLIILASPAADMCHLGDVGIALGHVFTRQRPSRRILDMDVDSARGLEASAGGVLLEQCWGGFVAFLTNANRKIIVVRDPSARMPCYYVRRPHLTLLASDAGMLVRAGAILPDIDWPYLAWHLSTPGYWSDRTCLESVCELPRGLRLTIDRGSQVVSAAWSPWAFTSAAASGRPDLEHFRDAVSDVVRSWAAIGEHVLVRVSGGLDSSIIADCLAKQSTPFTCLTLVTDDPIGDERKHARRIASATGSELVEARFELQHVDVNRSVSAHLPRPDGKAFAHSVFRIIDEVSNEKNADVVFDGGGGDHLFCSMRSALPVADALLSFGVNRQVWSAVGDVSALTSSTISDVVVEGVRLACSPRRHRWLRDDRFISKDALPTAPRGASHPWLDAVGCALPGRIAHATSIARAHNYIEQDRSLGGPDNISPLLSQPLIELCLGISTWWWTEGGCNRAVARAAFATSLPTETVNRRQKGSPSGFATQVFEAHRKAIRDLLLDGSLVREGICDARAIEKFFEQRGPVRDTSHSRIMQLADAEAWTSGWLSRRRELTGVMSRSAVS